MIVFPRGLPAPLRDGYGFDPFNNIVRTDMASGHAKQREGFETVPTEPQLTWIFTAPQALLFASWSAQVAKANWFTLALQTPAGYFDQQVRFKKTPVGPVLFGVDHWKYTAVCEIDQLPLAPPGFADLLPDWILLADIFDRAINQEWPEA